MSENKTKENYQFNVDIKPLNSKDIKIVAKLYKDTFSDHFLGHMGNRFLELFIAEFVNTTGNYGYVSKFKDEPIGFVLATTLDNPFNHFYRKNFLSLFFITVSRYVQDPFIREHIGKRLGHIKIALKQFLSFSKPSKNTNRQDAKVLTDVPPRLLAIAVDDKFRGLGVANELTRHFCVDMKGLGFKEVALSALPWNQRAIAFYKKDGWFEKSCSETSISFSRLL